MVAEGPIVEAVDTTDRGSKVASRKTTFEKQARLSVVLAAVGGLAALATIALLVRNFEGSWVMYDPHGRWLPVLAGALLVGLAAGAIGLFVGLNSASQRRNPRSQLAWTGFFLRRWSLR